MFKKIKLILSRLQALEDRIAQLEIQLQEQWEETHPRTMGGK